MKQDVMILMGIVIALTVASWAVVWIAQQLVTMAIGGS